MTSSLHPEHTYYLRSRSDNKQQSVSVSTSSPISPPTSTSPFPLSPKPCTSNTRITRKHNRKRRVNRRKRKFSQIEDECNAINNESELNENEDIDLNVITTNNENTDNKNIPLLPPSNTSNTTKKAKLSRTIKFTLNDETVISREASLAANSPLIMKPRRHYPRIEEFEVPISNRMTRRNPYICCYQFFNGYSVGIAMTLGAGNDLRSAIKILSQELVSGRAKASLQTQKNSFLVYIKNRKQKMIACAILHIDHVWKRVNIEMFAVDQYWRGNGFASMMVYLIQYRMIYYNKYDLFVCAANDAVPFWSNAKYNFLFAHKGILEQHEIEDEKHGGTRHMIWFGSCIQARCALLKYFVQSQ